MRKPDLMLAPVVGAVMVANAALNGRAGPLGYGLLVAAAVALHWHRRAPRLVLAVTTALALASILLVEPDLAAGLPALITVSSAVRHGHRPAALAAALTLVGGMVAAYLLAGQDALTAVKGGFLVMGWFVAAMAMGVALLQADQRAAEAERTREEAALRRAGEERLRIARELHDSLTHTISIIKVQAGVAVHLARKRGEEVPAALSAIQEASGEAMRELRETLEVLRDDSMALARLPELVERTRAAGQEVTLRLAGRSRTLPAAVEQTAYRIVQEALTNVAKHARGSRAAVLIEYGEHEVVVEVSDDGPGQAGGVPGVGLTGMRERVDALGGRLSAGPGERGGFTVRAELPVAERVLSA
ncbi:sensor histidine kinase [Thermoactinospora rubra]|uniref:sensor histidine kinase n=1 Tax=Thermoactinospora rubra TaxID=1088767 RepID=UPI000A0FB99A|nr:sensor histidine kinase [Thermoactinospora rubra]